MALAFDPPYAMFFVAWTIAAILGFLVLAFRWQHLPSRALGLAQGLTSMVGVTYGLAHLEQDAALSAFWAQSAAPVFSIARPFLWVYFTLSFPRPHWIARRPAGLALVFGPMLAIEAAFFVDPSWMSEDVHWVFISVGYLMGSVMSAVFFHRFLDQPPGPLREFLFLMSVGWLPGTSLVGGYHAITRYGTEPLVFASVVVFMLMVYVYGYLAWRFVRHERRSGARFEPWRRALFFGFPLSALAASGVAVAVFFGAGPMAGEAAAEVVDAIWCAAGVVLITYGTMKYQLLGIDLRLKWTIKRSTVAAAFVGVFFVGAQLAQNYLSSSLGWAVGGVAAGALLFAISPLQRFSERVADAAMPGVKPLAEMDGDERALLYLEQARFAWGDGQLTVKDRQILDVARQRLGLALDVAARLEKKAMGLEQPHRSAPRHAA